ncbi:MAG: 30S ribosomal protein S20 [Pyrinomonadaceae bacterium]|nr:30S ribosomal protein S20 [Pyrinomonadaceae bacterium]MCX7640646.1 30S ribosomal protein S20 [Pyrinomonadaceae bacterium]MDW8305347.1 30S ribosomal protein S20 [Acidobacteriota bacterium]
MANHKSAEKRARQNRKRRERNRALRSALRTQIKKLRAAIASGNKGLCLELLNETISKIDKSVTKGILHKNTAARYKSRLTLQVNRLAP